jgi:hypothetical protein
MSYKRKLSSPKWQKKRLEILKRDKWKCKLCKDTETELHVHHINYSGEPWEAPNSDLVTLCAHCHHEVEEVKEGVDFKDIKIYKSNNWDSGSRLMFINKGGGYITMRIYEEDGSYLRGFNIEGETLKMTKRILR